MVADWDAAGARWGDFQWLAGSDWKQLPPFGLPMPLGWSVSTRGVPKGNFPAQHRQGGPATAGRPLYW